MIRDNACITGDAEVYDDAAVFDNAQVGGNASIGGFTAIHSYEHISGNAHILDNDNHSTIQGFGTEYRNITFFKQRDGSIGVNCQRYDCIDETSEYFFDTIDKFREYTGLIMNKKIAEEYLTIADLMENHFSNLNIEEVQEYDDWYDEFD